MRQTGVEIRMIVLINTSKRFGWDIPTPDLNVLLAMGFWGVSEKSFLVRHTRTLATRREYDEEESEIQKRHLF